MTEPTGGEQPPAHPENTADVEHSTGVVRLSEAFNILAVAWNVFTHHDAGVEKRALAVQPLVAHLRDELDRFEASVNRIATTELRLASIERAERKPPTE